MDAHIKSYFRHILVVYSHLKPVNKSYAALFATETLVIRYEIQHDSLLAAFSFNTHDTNM